MTMKAGVVLRSANSASRSPHLAKRQEWIYSGSGKRAAADRDVRFLAYLVLHDIARNRSLEQLVRFGVNTVLSTFQRFLEREDEAGICLVDRLPYRHGA